MTKLEPNQNIRAILRGLAFLVLGLAATGCASQNQYRQAIDERDHEIRQLREERTSLKNQLRDLQFNNQALETALAEASSRTVSQVESAAVVQETPQFETLNNMGIDTNMRGDDMVISIPSEITFPSGKAELTKGGARALAEVARVLRDNYGASTYWIEGHTDSDPISKSGFDSNRQLSLLRALAVLHYLVETADVPDENCVVAGWGEYAPVASNDSPSNKSRNRRVEIVVRN